ncbi:MAG: ribbon-helix-helix domain-containing protein [Candidatus Woesearchaeota archaeon]|nr:ribbon-helix-helix domain-containing protein [Candidatus Woesearchaeota archaeon]
MAKKPKDNSTKERITITIDKELLEWLDEKVNSKIFANRSHGIEFLIKRRMEEEKDDKAAK